MSYKKELQDLALLLRNGSLMRMGTAHESGMSWFDQCNRWAEIIEFAISHPDDFKANLDTD